MTKTTTTAPAAPEMPAEQAADLAALIERAEKTDPAALATEPADVPKLADEIAGAITAAVSVLAPAFPSLRTIYTDETTAAAGAAIGGVCEKHGWLGGGLFGEYGEEIACVAVCGPLAFATWQAVRADLEKMRAKAKPAAERIAGQGVDLSATPPPPAPAPPKTVQFGAPLEAAA